MNAGGGRPEGGNYQADAPQGGSKYTAYGGPTCLSGI
jgi:hypothetical protein